jgi:cbb3-type cytochrome oxidase cytochrome c subunit
MTRTVGMAVVALALTGAMATRVQAGIPAEQPRSAVAAVGQAPDPKLVNDGKKLYVTYKCDKCHTIAGRGTKKKDGELDGVGTKLTAADIKKWMTTPAVMEAKLAKPPKDTDSMSNALKTKGIEPGEIDSLVAYMQSLTKK